MRTDDWTFQACPKCLSDQIVRTVLANMNRLGCIACRHNWTVRRMPSDAEAAEILKRSRQMRTEVRVTDAAGDSLREGDTACSQVSAANRVLRTW
jgi:hypothetical protein